MSNSKALAEGLAKRGYTLVSGAVRALTLTFVCCHVPRLYCPVSTFEPAFGMLHALLCAAYLKPKGLSPPLVPQSSSADWPACVYVCVVPVVVV
jgi:hypothetical protein